MGQGKNARSGLYGVHPIITNRMIDTIHDTVLSYREDIIDEPLTASLVPMIGSIRVYDCIESHRALLASPIHVFLSPFH